MTGLTFDPLGALFAALSLFPTMILHELAHGYVADRMGDMSPRLHGRLTVNPRRHIDPFGTLVLPGLLLLPQLFGYATPAFGYAKPMPLEPSRLKNPDRQLALIMLAGPVVNLVLAVLGSVAYRFLLGVPYLDRFLLIFMLTNLLVAILHIFPIPPLDGAKVLATLLPPRPREVMERLEPYGALFMLLIFFLFSGPVLFMVEAIRSGLVSLLV
jgi:Zn-dependent protease